MKRNKYFQLITFFLIFFSWQTSSQENYDCDGCIIFLEPIIGFNIDLLTEKNNIHNYFEDLQKADNLILKKKGVTYYNSKKIITLPNGKITELEALLGFDEKNKLIFYNFSIPIGSDHTYFFELKKILKKKDVNNINHFLYTSDNFQVYKVDENCSKWFGIKRSADHSSFKIFIKVASNEY